MQFAIRHASTRPLLPAVMAPLQTLARRPRLWVMRYRTRRALGRLTAHLMKDIGLDAQHCQAEAARPFWKE